MLLQRVMGNPAALGAQEALEIATLGGASVLGRDDIGALAPGMAADFIGYRLERLDFAGALHDPLAALVFCTPPKVDLSVINGKVRVKDGEIVGLDVRGADAAAQRDQQEDAAGRVMRATCNVLRESGKRRYVFTQHAITKHVFV